ncbi:MAG: hypothetical protein C5B54_00350 [Acidobacteria bacterium]|nr:MAG: hypothetical protein C5B54_00350 [Acidobacteriota bacterium]
MYLNRTVLFIFALFFCPLLQAQEHHHHMDMEMKDPVSEFLMKQASGTSANPESSPMHMSAYKLGTWNLMLHGVVFIVDGQQTGPRGADKFFSANWFMGVAQHKLGKGIFQFRSMMSLEPATVTDRQYPLLFQTGETAFGKPIVDGQHPHDLFMELSVQYAFPITSHTVGSIYFAPVGDPPLGPVAFPHRASASEFPQATLSHHWQDSSHIVNEVLTGVVEHGIFRFEAGGFHGAEPDENRWNIDHGPIDSWAARLTISPRPNWSGQISGGFLKKPEELEADNIMRTTASLSYNRPMTDGNWATSFIWGRNHKSVEKRNLNAYTLESVYQFRTKNYLSGRFEYVDKDELFSDEPENPLSNSVFKIGSYTFGYTRDFDLIPNLLTGIGANVTLYTFPEELIPYYGNHPAAFFMFLRIRQRH